MSKVSPKEMSNLLQAELRRREKLKNSGGLSREQLADIYKQAKREKLEDEQKSVKRKFTIPKVSINRRVLAAGLVLAVAVIYSAAKEPVVESPPVVVDETQVEPWSEGEVLLLTQLDKRRAELDRREAALKENEREFEAQKTLIEDQLLQLTALTEKLAATNKNKNVAREERLKQLADVYGSMAPQDAAPLIAQLETDLALDLLERLPKKRMAQVLSLMQPERALALTKALTE